VSFFTQVRDAVERAATGFVLGVPIGATTVLDQADPTVAAAVNKRLDIAAGVPLKVLSTAELLAQNVAPAVATGLVTGVGDLVANRAIYNVATGKPVANQIGSAAFVEAVGALAGYGIAVSGLVDAAATTGAAPAISAAPDLAAIDLSSGAAPSIGGVDLTAAGGSSVISPVSSVAIDAGATAPAGSSLSSILAGGKAAIGAVGTVSGLVRLVNPPKPPTVPAPRPPVVAPAPPCATCAKAQPAAGALAALLPLVLYAFS
jgi:hypothetical protein